MSLEDKLQKLVLPNGSICMDKECFCGGRERLIKLVEKEIKEAKEEGRKEGKQEADHPVGGIDMKQAEKVFLNGLK